MYCVAWHCAYHSGSPRNVCGVSPAFDTREQARDWIDAAFSEDVGMWEELKEEDADTDCPKPEMFSDGDEAIRTENCDRGNSTIWYEVCEIESSPARNIDAFGDDSDAAIEAFAAYLQEVNPTLEPSDGPTYDAASALIWACDERRD